MDTLGMHKLLQESNAQAGEGMSISGRPSTVAAGASRRPVSELLEQRQGRMRHSSSTPHVGTRRYAQEQKRASREFEARLAAMHTRWGQDLRDAISRGSYLDAISASGPDIMGPRPLKTDYSDVPLYASSPRESGSPTTRRPGMASSSRHSAARLPAQRTSHRQLDRPGLVRQRSFARSAGPAHRSPSPRVLQRGGTSSRHLLKKQTTGNEGVEAWRPALHKPLRLDVMRSLHAPPTYRLPEIVEAGADAFDTRLRGFAISAQQAEESVRREPALCTACVRRSAACDGRPQESEGHPRCTGRRCPHQSPRLLHGQWSLLLLHDDARAPACCGFGRRQLPLQQ
jgi:hypothetical protein